MKKVTSWAICLTVVAAFMGGGCSYKDIYCNPEGMHEVMIVFEWERARNARPEGMTVMFYPLDPDGRTWHFELPGRAGGRVSVPEGRYQVLAWNNDTRYDYFRHTDSFDLAQAYTMGANVDTEGLPLPQQPLRRATQEIWAATATEVSVSLCGLEYIPNGGGQEGDCKHCPVGVLRMWPERRYSDWTCIWEDVVNIGSVAAVRAICDGMSEAVTLADGRPAGVSVAVPFGVAKAENDLQGSWLNFDRAPGERVNVNLYVWLRDGKKQIYTADVTEQVEDVIAPQSISRNVEIRLRGLEFPAINPGDTINGGEGAFEVNVGDWETVTINLTN